MLDFLLTAVKRIGALTVSEILATFLPSDAIIVGVAFVSLISVVVSVGVANTVVSVVSAVPAVCVVVVVNSSGVKSRAQWGLFSLVTDSATVSVISVVSVVYAAVSGIERTISGLYSCRQMIKVKKKDSKITKIIFNTY